MSFATETSAPGLTLKKFVTQDEVDEKKKQRQEEWERVRKPEEPIECPEAPVDNRCLYEKLEEQRLRKQEEHDDKYKFKNQVATLDEDESKFLEFVSDRQQDMVKARDHEEAVVLSEMKDAQVFKVAESTSDDKKPRSSTSAPVNKKSQMALLAGAVKRKGSDESTSSKRPRSEDTADSPSPEAKDVESPRRDPAAARIIAVLPSVLPGLSHYEPSSDSESSSSDSEPDFSLASRNNVALAMRQMKRAMQHHN